MSAAVLTQRLRNKAEAMPENPNEAGFVTSLPALPSGKVTQKIDPLRGKTGACNPVTSVTPFSEQVQNKHTKSGTGQAANDAAMPDSEMTQAPETDWRAADAAYLRHHWLCPACCAAGHGRGERCTTGRQAAKLRQDRGKPAEIRGTKTVTGEQIGERSTKYKQTNTLKTTI